jgi:hypothetical protein
MATSSSRRSRRNPEFEELRKLELELARKQKQMAELPKLLEKERRESACTMPPLADHYQMVRTRRYEQEIATRGEIRNIQKAQTRSLLLIVTMLMATVALIAWGLRLMQG